MSYSKRDALEPSIPVRAQDKILRGRRHRDPINATVAEDRSEDCTVNGMCNGSKLAGVGTGPLFALLDWDFSFEVSS